MQEIVLWTSTGLSLGIAAILCFIVSTGGVTRTTLKSKEKKVLLLPSLTIHSRFAPVLHSFRYPVLYIGIDLDDLGHCDSLFSSNDGSWRILTLRGRDYLGSRHAGSIKEKLWSHLHDHGIDTADLRRAFLVTTPRLLGYAFNPVSFHYVYDSKEALKVVVLEVNNTFSEKHVYVLQQAQFTDRVRSGYDMAQTFPRRFHVSPFNDRSGSYQLQCGDPFRSTQVSVDMHLTLLESDGSKKLTAQVNSTRPGMSTSETLRCLWTLLQFGSAVFLTVPRILYQAYVLHYGKKLAVYLRPEPFEDPGAIGRQAASPDDRYFMNLVLDSLRHRRASIDCKRIVFDILPSPALDDDDNGSSSSKKPHTTITIECSNERGEELRITILSYTFFTSLVTSESPLAALWTDSLARLSPDSPSSASPIFRTSDDLLFLRLFSKEVPLKSTSRRVHLDSLRRRYRASPAWFRGELPTEFRPFQHDTNQVFDDEISDTASASSSSSSSSFLKGSWILWTYRYRVFKALWLGHLGNTLFDSVATFAGVAGGASDEWLRVKMELERRRRKPT